MELDDVRARLVGIPGFGILIPNFTGLFGDYFIYDWEYWLGYLYFIFLAFLIWQGNRFLLYIQRSYVSWFSHPITKLMLLVSSNVFYTAPVTVAFIWGWYTFSEVGPVDWGIIKIVALTNVICVLFVAHGYETIFLIKERENDLSEIERLDKTRALSELEALKQQIDPHFMFNSLNTMAYLIENDPPKALSYNNSLADVYRYILMNKDRELVLLREELNFLKDYFSLLHLRFGSSLQLTLNLDASIETQYLLPPLSLQLLVENAVKHNEFSESQVLEVRIEQQEESLLVMNPMRPSPLPASSLGIGLSNLAERYELVVGERIEYGVKENRFQVQLPLLPSQ